MKNLILVRHAKAKKDLPGIRDIDRPLSRAGYDESYQLKGEVKKFLKGNVLFASSPSVRTLSTAGIFADENNYPRVKIRTDITLYESSEEEYFDFIKSVEKDVDSLLIFGHNPTISQIAHRCTKGTIGDLPTCAIVVLEFNTNDWEGLLPDEAKLLAVFSPKS